MPFPQGKCHRHPRTFQSQSCGALLCFAKWLVPAWRHRAFPQGFHLHCVSWVSLEFSSDWFEKSKIFNWRHFYNFCCLMFSFFNELRELCYLCPVISKHGKWNFLIAISKKSSNSLIQKFVKKEYFFKSVPYFPAHMHQNVPCLHEEGFIISVPSLWWCIDVLVCARSWLVTSVYW